MTQSISINTPSLNDEYLAIIDSFSGAEADRRKAWEIMKGSTAIYNGQVIFTGFFPKLYDKGCLVRLNQIAETAYGIIKKVMDHYRCDAAYRACFNFDPRMEELICLPQHIDSYLPFGRIDLFLNEETGEATFCEFNADGSSGMNENREVTASIIGSRPYQQFATKHALQDCNDILFKGWIREFLRLYHTHPKAVDTPHVAICDYLENSILEEFKIYQNLFEEAGCTCSIYDIRDLTYEGGHLIGHHPYTELGKSSSCAPKAYSVDNSPSPSSHIYGLENAPIDVVWRRCVSSDVLDHWDESLAFIDAIKADDVALIGSFAGHIVHDKRLFTVLSMDETKAILNDEENAFVNEMIPQTRFLSHETLTDDEIDEIVSDPYNWILKPTDGYGCKDVCPGPMHMDGTWKEMIEQRIDSRTGVPFLVQRFCHPYTTPAMPFYNQEEDFTADAKPYKNMEGLYLMDGKFVGIFSRLGPNPIILGRHGGITEASIYVDADEWLTEHGWIE